jgi:uncharacterized damage-inducible protein DinB
MLHRLEGRRVIQKDYVLLMARYNAWQNSQLRRTVQQMDEVELHKDRVGFFGSIFGTLNHILWGDMMWMSRFCSDVAKPETSIAESRDFRATRGEWDADRFRLDGRIRIWAETLSNMNLQGNLSWFSGAIEEDVTRPVGLCVAHMFNHQTHHRGQISQMLSAAGMTPPVSDLFLLPKDA